MFLPLSANRSALGIPVGAKSVLFQFMLSESFAAAACIDALKDRLECYFSLKDKKLDGLENVAALCADCKKWILSLSHIATEPSPSNMLNPSEGSFDKILYYCRNYPADTEQQIIHLREISRQISSGLHACLDLNVAFTEIMPLSRVVSDHVLDPQWVLALVEKLTQSMEGVKKALLVQSEAFGRDENVLLFLLRHREAFERCFGEDSLDALLQTMFSEDVQEVQKFVQKKYEHRGFQVIVP